MLKVGVIGGGRMGTVHATTLKNLKDVKISGVYDIDSLQAKTFTETFGSTSYAGPEELAASPEVDFILICSPTYCHLEGVKAAMKTAKPIFCEKPLCRTKAELKEFAPLITSYKNLFAIGFVRRYSAGTIMMKKMIEEGKLGNLICGSIKCMFGGYKREWGDWFADYDKSGGVTLDMLAHHCDLQNSIVGKPLSVYAKAFMLDRSKDKPYDYVSATATFKNGYFSNIESSWLRNGFSDTYMMVYGDKASLKLSDSEGLIFYEEGKAPQTIELDESIVGHLQETISGNMYAMEMAVLVDCVRNGKKPYAGAEAAIDAMTFCLGMIDSAETGKVVTF